MITIDEKVAIRGVGSLSDRDLIALLLDDMGDAEGVAGRILEHFSNSLSCVAREELSRLRMVEGIGKKRALRILAASEIGSRTAASMMEDRITIKSSGDAIQLLRPLLSDLPHEEFWVVYLNVANKIVGQYKISQGGVSSTIVDTRIVVKRALELLATHIIIAHNHPSGSVQPSDDDIALTKRIKQAVEFFDMKLLDHIIISNSEECSLADSGII